MISLTVLSDTEMNELIYPLNEYEYKGENLPPKIVEDAEHPFFDLTFQVRVYHDKEGRLELTFLRKNSKRYTVRMFEGLSKTQACNAQRVFLQHIGKMLEDTCYSYAWACYDRQGGDLEKRKETYDEIMEYHSNCYKDALIWDRRKIIKITEENCIKKVTTRPIERGTKPQTDSTLKKERQELLKNIFTAFTEYRKSHKSKLPTQKQLSWKIFKKSNNPEEMFSKLLSKHNFKFKDLWKIFSANYRNSRFSKLNTWNK